LVDLIGFSLCAFADAMRQALSQPQVAQAKGRAGRQRVLESFSLDATVAKYEALYQGLVDGRT